MRHIKAKAGVSNIGGDKTVRVLAILPLFLIALIVAVPACSGGAAISGSFSAHDYVLAQGEEISSRDIYVVAFNNMDVYACLDMKYEAPESIVVNLSPQKSLLGPDESKKVYITLKAKEDAVPDNYTVKVIAMLKEVYFCWDDVPGEDNERFKKFLEVLFGLDWVEHAAINKSGDNLTINVSTAENAAEIILDAEQKEATLNIRDGGTYELEVKSENGKLNIYKKEEDELPIKVITSAAQEADITVTGEYAHVDIAAIDPVGNIASTALVRLLRSGYEVANAKGELKKRVVPGNYTAKAYSLGEEVANASFEVRAYEEKRVELLIKSVYFEVFDTLPVRSDSGSIIFVYVVAVVKNLYKELPNASIVLNVYTGVDSENYTLYSSGSLPMNRTETRSYIPLMGWQSGKYKFTARVISGGALYAVSPARIVEDLTFGANYKRAQTFLLSDNLTVTNVSVYLKRADELVHGDVYVRIHEDGGIEPGTELACCSITNSSVNTTYGWVNASLNCSLTGGTTYWLVLESPDASSGYDYYWGADYKKNAAYKNKGAAWYYNGNSWTTDNLEGLIMTFELTTAQDSRIGK
ncbi:MAG: hypothetical protein N2V75_04260 [Methanophagales archaeon]|nr:hypothetical protein [Methanophagales archaeon]